MVNLYIICLKSISLLEKEIKEIEFFNQNYLKGLFKALSK
jgi:hypothetical protein